MGENWYEPKPHTMVYDLDKGIVAEVMDIAPDFVTLRKPHGGVEWDRRKTRIRRPTPSEEIRAKTKVANAQTANRPRGGL